MRRPQNTGNQRKMPPADRQVASANTTSGNRSLSGPQMSAKMPRRSPGATESEQNYSFCSARLTAYAPGHSGLWIMVADFYKPAIHQHSRQPSTCPAGHSDDCSLWRSDFAVLRARDVTNAATARVYFGKHGGQCCVHRKHAAGTVTAVLTKRWCEVRQNNRACSTRMRMLFQDARSPVRRGARTIKYSGRRTSASPSAGHQEWGESPIRAVLSLCKSS